MKKLICLILFISSAQLFANETAPINAELIVKVINELKTASYTPVNEQELLKTALDAVVRKQQENSNARVIFNKNEDPSSKPVRAGLGITIKTINEKDKFAGVEIVGLYPNGAGAAAGFKTGDKIVSVDGHKTQSLTNIEAVTEKIVGAVNTKVCLGVLRGSEAKNICAVRKIINAPRILTHITGDEVATIEILRVEKDHIAKDLSDALAQIEAKKIKKVVFDFRFKEFMDLDGQSLFMQQLLPTDTPLFHFKTKTGVETYKTNSNRSTKRALEFYVLQSASNSGGSGNLILMLKKNFGAKLIGEKVIVRGFISKLLPVGDDISVLVHNGEITDLEGKPISGQEIEPDIHVSDVVKLDISNPNILKQLTSPIEFIPKL